MPQALTPLSPLALAFLRIVSSVLCCVAQSSSSSIVQFANYAVRVGLNTNDNTRPVLSRWVTRQMVSHYQTKDPFSQPPLLLPQARTLLVNYLFHYPNQILLQSTSSPIPQTKDFIQSTTPPITQTRYSFSKLPLPLPKAKTLLLNYLSHYPNLGPLQWFSVYMPP